MKFPLFLQINLIRQLRILTSRTVSGIHGCFAVIYMRP
uniref:Uncharacterized protein n=1 Tax=Rhizophora mucronata TaxID=61149 RepID=A0A2P2QVF4_RHIMU